MSFHVKTLSLFASNYAIIADTAVNPRFMCRQVDHVDVTAFLVIILAENSD